MSHPRSLVPTTPVRTLPTRSDWKCGNRSVPLLERTNCARTNSRLGRWWRRTLVYGFWEFHDIRADTARGEAFSNPNGLINADGPSELLRLLASSESPGHLHPAAVGRAELQHWAQLSERWGVRPPLGEFRRDDRPARVFRVAPQPARVAPSVTQDSVLDRLATNRSTACQYASGSGGVRSL